jgi:hypothetical protein
MGKSTPRKPTTVEDCRQVSSFLSELTELMQKYGITELGGGYGEGTDTHGVIDEHFKVRHKSGFFVRMSSCGMTVTHSEVRELRDDTEKDIKSMERCLPPAPLGPVKTS